MKDQVGTWPRVKGTAITKTIGWRDVTLDLSSSAH